MEATIRNVKPAVKLLRTSLCVALAMTAFSVPARADLAFAASDETASSSIEGQIRWDDNEDAAGKRPGEVTVHLMQDGKEIGTAQVSAENDWNYSFAVEVPAGGNAKYQVSADETEGYVEDADGHVDPELDFTYPQSSDWDKYEPNNELEISSDLLSGGILAGKTTAHQPMVVWTAEELTPLQQKLVFESLKGIPGSGNPPSAVFITGDASTEYGMSVLSSGGVVKFEHPSNWALLYAGLYQKGSCDFTKALIVKKLIEQAGPDADVPGTDPSPSAPGGGTAPDAPVVDPSPDTPGTDSNPETPEVPGGDPDADTPDTPGAPDSPDVPGTGSDVPGDGTDPDAPDTPGTGTDTDADVPGDGTDPDAPDIPGTGTDADVPGTDPDPEAPGDNPDTDAPESGSEPDSPAVPEGEVAATTQGSPSQAGYDLQDAGRMASALPQTGDGLQALGVGALALASLIASLVLARRMTR